MQKFPVFKLIAKLTEGLFKYMGFVIRYDNPGLFF